jgi:hypothetical protein
VVPLCGIAILGYVVIEAKVAAQAVGLVWLGIGLIVMTVLLMRRTREGHRVPPGPQ